MDMTRPCSCQGNNERCYKCDGTGYLPERHVTKPLKAGGIVMRQFKTKRRVASIRSVSGSVKKEVPAIQPQQQALPPPPRMMLRLPDDAQKPMYLVREGIRFTRCNRCSFYVVSERFLVHDDVCAHRQVRPELPPYSPPILSKLLKPQDRVACMHCRNMVNRENMGRHLRRIHGIDPTQVPLSDVTTTTPVPSSASLLASKTAAGYLFRNG
ncbi:hypothetical protein, partial [Massilia sp.]|uniref:hypothetical protein n=1 Tax=Massilia sp. TaxID=1882437 RepID=UPI0028AB1499